MSNWVIAHLGTSAVNLDSGMVLQVGGEGRNDDSETWTVDVRSLHVSLHEIGKKTIQSGMTLSEARELIEQLARINSIYYTDADAWLANHRSENPVKEGV